MRVSFGPSPIYIFPSVVIGIVVFAFFFYLYESGSPFTYIFLVIFAIPITLMLLYTNLRTLKVYEDRLTIYSIFGKTEIPFDSISLVKVMRIGIRNVLLIEADGRIYLTPFVFSSVAELKDILVEKLGNKVERVGWERSIGDIILIYLIAILLLLVFLVKVS